MRRENQSKIYGAFGMEMVGKNYSSNSYRYGFNGKEKDDEIKGSSGTSYDYGFRIYDPRLGRFLSVDPIARSFPWYTPYQYAGNKPIVAIDMDGLEDIWVHYIQKDDGSFIKVFEQINLTDAQKVAVWKAFGIQSKDNGGGALYTYTTPTGEHRINWKASTLQTDAAVIKPPAEASFDASLVGSSSNTTGMGSTDPANVADNGKQAPAAIKLLNSFNPLVSVPNAVKVLTTGEDIYNVKKEAASDKVGAVLDLAGPVLRVFKKVPEFIKSGVDYLSALFNVADAIPEGSKLEGSSNPVP